MPSLNWKPPAPPPHRGSDSHLVAALRRVLADRERELLELKGPCSNTRCGLHYAHSGPCECTSDIDTLIERSSLGTPEARRLRASVPDEAARAVVARSEEIAREDRCCTCRQPISVHVCLTCSPDRRTPGPGCRSCRRTGWDQTPCQPPAARSGQDGDRS